MYKVVGLIKRPPDMEFEAFKRWWLEEHAPRVSRWPGLLKYTVNLCTTPDQAYDGMAEVWFGTRADMDAIFARPEGRGARERATALASDIAILLTEEHLIVD